MGAKKIGLSLIVGLSIGGAVSTSLIYSQAVDSVVSRLGIVYPAYDSPGGRPLYEKQQKAWEKVGDNMNSRYSEYVNIGANQVVTINHGLGVELGELSVLLYGGIDATKTRIAAPSQVGWRIDTDNNNASKAIQITTPSLGGPFDFSVAIIHDGGALTRDFTVNTPSASYIGPLGSPDNPDSVIGGHTLTDLDVPPQVSKYAFWNFNDSLEQSSATPFCGSACIFTVTPNTGVTYGAGIKGEKSVKLENSPLVINSTAFNPYSTFAVSFWFKPSLVESIELPFFGTLEGGSGYQLSLNDSKVRIAIATIDGIKAITSDIAFQSKWTHLALVVDPLVSEIWLYVDTNLIARERFDSRMSIEDANDFRLGGTPDQLTFSSVLIDEFFFGEGELTQDDIVRMTSHLFTHDTGLQASKQLWDIKLDGVVSKTDRVFLSERSANAIEWNFLGEPETSELNAVMYENAVSVDTFDVATYDSQMLTVAPTGPIAHGLGILPAKVTIQYEQSGQWSELDSSLCKFDVTNLYCDFAGRTVGPNNRLRILASRSPIALGALEAGTNQRGIITDRDQVLGGDKTIRLSYPVGDVVTLQGGLTISGTTDSIVRLDPNGRDRTITLSSVGWTKGRVIHLCNVGKDFQLAVRAFDQSEVSTVLSGDCGRLIATASNPVSSSNWLSI